MTDLDHFNKQLDLYLEKRQQTRQALAGYNVASNNAKFFYAQLMQELNDLKKSHSISEIKQYCEKKHWYRIEALHRATEKEK